MTVALSSSVPWGNQKYTIFKFFVNSAYKNGFAKQDIAILIAIECLYSILQAPRGRQLALQFENEKILGLELIFPSGREKQSQPSLLQKKKKGKQPLLYGNVCAPQQIGDRATSAHPSLFSGGFICSHFLIRRLQ